MGVKLHRHVPERPQTLGFSYGLADEQLSYLLAEATVEGLALEAVEHADLLRLLAAPEFVARSGASLRWLAGLDLLPALDLHPFTGLQRIEGYVFNDADTLAALRRAAAGLRAVGEVGGSGRPGALVLGHQAAAAS